jgi:hypothetical protein
MCLWANAYSLVNYLSPSRFLDKVSKANFYSNPSFLLIKLLPHLSTRPKSQFWKVKDDLSVPDRRRRNPEVVLVRRWVIWVLGIWKGRVWGRGGSRGVSLQATWDQGGWIISQLGGFQVSRRGLKGSKGNQQGETKKARGMRHYMQSVLVYIMNAWTCEWYQSYMYIIIIIIGMNVVDNLNSV